MIDVNAPHLSPNFLPAHEAAEYDSLTECFQGVWHRFFVEILDINDGTTFQLAITPHGDDNWNCSSTHPLDHATGETMHFAYGTLAEALDALATFQRATVTDAQNVPSVPQ